MHETLGLIGLMLAAGALSARLSWLPDNAAETLHRFVIRVCLPALVLTTVPGLRWQWGLLLVVLTPWLLLGVGVLLVTWGARRFGWPREVVAALLLCVPLGNTSFFGFPMLEALVGPEAVRLGVLYDQFGSFMMLASYGLLVVARHDGGEVPGLRTVALRVLTFPSVLALGLALVIPHAPWIWPSTAQILAARIGATLVPIAMFAVGLKLQLRPPRPRRAFFFGLAVKLGVFPALAWLGAWLSGAGPLVTRVVVLESGMPAMISAGAMAIMAGLAPELAAALIGYGIVISLLTLPLWLSVL